MNFKSPTGGGLESILSGLLDDQAAKFDSNFADTLQNHLFENVLPDNRITAIDLLAANINRGRDHGIPPYFKYRDICGGKKPTDFDTLLEVMIPSKVNKLRSLYKYNKFLILVDFI